MTSQIASALTTPLVDCFDDHLQKGFSVLLRAYFFARHAQASPWDTAVSILELRETGLTNSDFHWLLACHYAEHARETTSLGADRRSFVGEGRAVFHAKTCFVLTQSGAEFAARLLRMPPIKDEAVFDTEARKAVSTYDVAVHPEFAARHGTIPTWDARCRELRVGDVLVKRFRVPAANQEVILSTFQDEGWPERIDDPLSPSPEISPKRRLHDTIGGLNRNQMNQLVKFFGNGTSDGVCWKLINVPGD